MSSQRKDRGRGPVFRIRPNRNHEMKGRAQEDVVTLLDTAGQSKSGVDFLGNLDTFMSY